MGKGIGVYWKLKGQSLAGWLASCPLYPCFGFDSRTIASWVRDPRTTQIQHHVQTESVSSLFCS